MRILIGLMQWIYDNALGLFVAKESATIAVRAAFIAVVIATITAIYAAYAYAISQIALTIPPEFDIALMIIPDNTPTCLTALTTLRLALFVASTKISMASIGVN